MFIEVAPSVFSAAHRSTEGKNGIIIGARCALAIDAGSYPEEGQAMADFIQAHWRNPDRLALTHGHSDHVLGGAVFKDGEVFSHVATPAVISELLPQWAERSDESITQVEARVIWPTITFTDELCIDLGGKKVRLFWTPGHSDDSACAYVVEDRVLFAGDTVFSGIVPAIGNGDSVQLELTLRVLAEMEIEVLVPGHGQVLYGKESVREWLTWLVNYLADIRAFVRDQLGRGRDPEAVVDAVDYQRFVGNRLSAQKHGMVNRHRSTVAKIVEEELMRKGEME
jgi:glyoxylase-like metal-dependent hydrolase (beta-lactamase superfamily II)